MIFTNPAPCVGVFFITDKNEVILSVRGIEPFKGKLDSFGGFVDEGETAEEALVRELEEEAGLTVDQYEPFKYISTETGLYPYGGEDRVLLGIYFWSRLKAGVTLTANDDVANIVHIPLQAVDMTQLDNTDVRQALQKLQQILS